MATKSRAAVSVANVKTMFMESEGCSVTIREAHTLEITDELATACGKLMPFMYEGDGGDPSSAERLLAIVRHPSTLLIATLGDITFGNISVESIEEDSPLPIIRIPFSGDSHTRLSAGYPVIGQAVLHRVGGFRDGKGWLDDLVVHPEARGGSPSVGSVLYDTAVSLSRDRGDRSLFYTAAPCRQEAHGLYLGRGAVILAGDESSRTNLFAHNL